jgi:hypothetical protein
VDKKFLESKNLGFSGTDNGIVTMTETVGFSLDRFKYHVKLFNTYAALNEPSSPSK